MFAWKELLREESLAAILPGDYARFVTPVREALVLFLETLPAARQSEILARQATLPATASFSQRLASLAGCCPVLHKLGQILARDQRLALELRQQLSTLESLPPGIAPHEIEPLVKRELGARELVRLTGPPLAEASVAFVVPFEPTSRNRPTSPTVPLAGPGAGVLKILKPGIEERLEQELDILGTVSTHLDTRCEELGIPQLDYEEAFHQVSEKLRGEIRLDEEQRHLVRAAACYANEPRVHIPALLEFCTPRITAMERISGGKVTDQQLTPTQKKWLAKLVVRALIAHPIFSPSNEAIFHADPHAGNLFLTSERRLAILDWSLVGQLGEAERSAMVRVMLNAAILDVSGIVAILEDLCDRQRVDRVALERVVRGKVEQIALGTPPGLSWLTAMLDEAVHQARLRVAGELMMFRKSLYTLEGVVADLSGNTIRADNVLRAEFVKHFASEWPRRWLTPANSRDFPTRLSTLELSQAVWQSPLTVARFWLDHAATAWTSVPQ